MLTWGTVCCGFIRVIAFILPIGMVIMYRILILKVSFLFLFSRALDNQHHRILMWKFLKRGNKVCSILSPFFSSWQPFISTSVLLCIYICAEAAFVFRGVKHSFDGEWIFFRVAQQGHQTCLLHQHSSSLLMSAHSPLWFWDHKCKSKSR